ncbi:MAG: GGDEF domain-containing protein [Alteraurantiacibacter sp.]
MSPLSPFQIAVPEGTYVELVQSLFRTLIPTSIIAVSFMAVVAAVLAQTADMPSAALGILGSVVVLARLVIQLKFRVEASQANLTVKRARRLERIFALAYLLFAALFGLFCARAFVIASQDMHVLVVALLVGYAAGVAAGIAYRPWISVAAMLLGVFPTILVSLFSANAIYNGVSVLLAVFLLGGIQSMLAHYRFVSAGITMQGLFADLAQNDGLTALRNRYGLREQFNQITMLGQTTGDLAIHCLDLDRFKPVNDQYGHPVGDLLLQAVSGRLANILRGSDFAARIGGDEFVVVQSGITDRSEADFLARRIVRAVSAPYGIANHTITIGTSVGFALASENGHSLEKLIAVADDALLRSKRAGGGRICHSESVKLAG